MHLPIRRFHGLKMGKILTTVIEVNAVPPSRALRLTPYGTCPLKSRKRLGSSFSLSGVELLSLAEILKCDHSNESY